MYVFLYIHIIYRDYKYTMFDSIFNVLHIMYVICIYCCNVCVYVCVSAKGSSGENMFTVPKGDWNIERWYLVDESNSQS